MKALFVHSHRFAYHNDKFYSEGSFPKTAWSRYLKHFSDLVVLGRKSKDSYTKNLSLSSHNNVSFELLDYLENPMALFIYKSKLKEDIKNIISLHNINALIARLPSSIGNIAIDVAQELNIPFAVEVVGCSFDAIYNYKFSPWYHYGNLGVKILAPISSYMQKKHVAKSKYVIYVTERYLQEVYPAHLNAITSSASNVELPDFEKPVLEQHFYFLKRTDKVVKFGMIGNLDVHYKGYDIALKALAIIKDQIPKFELHIVGSGEGKSIKALSKKLNLQENIVFRGKLPSGNKIFEYLDSLDIYLHPSRQEGLPRSLIEAMGRACPCLASNVAGIPELLENNFMHTPGDYKTLSHQILNLILSKEKLIVASQVNFTKAKEYNIDVLSRKRRDFWGAFYENVRKRSNDE